MAFEIINLLTYTISLTRNSKGIHRVGASNYGGCFFLFCGALCLGNNEIELSLSQLPESLSCICAYNRCRSE